ncbi:MAG: hypothetical protein PWQ15_1150 [Methanobacterium sp.]|jgi:hypothetical protein|uniref:hypothetical protein n=1 Tax=Methanobacterium sp. TaxID=2164 RepID=UPI0003C9D866|nr:hypothetical protein [Methanobacterium sp.]MDI3550048.1 hypothetical protein [Methanobacterium sp.]CDG64984.1 hypothetical protein MBMB1_0882 [Methanobacterium sp. MB1]
MNYDPDDPEFAIDKSDFTLICPECGVANPNGSQNCLVCDRDLTQTVLFLEDDPFDLELTRTALIEYRKNFWGTERTGKVLVYTLSEISNIEYGSPITRFKFDYKGERQVIPLRKENMEILKEVLPKVINPED